MYFGLKAKETLLITLLTFLVVATTTVVHLSQLTRVVIQEALRHAELTADQIYAQSRLSLSQARGRTPLNVLRRDAELRSLIDASVGYSPHLLYALIADRKGRTILHTEREKEGSRVLERPSLRGLLTLDFVSRFRSLYRDGKIYEASLPLILDGKPFGRITLGIATSLLRKELTAGLKQSLAVAGMALTVAWLFAIGLANRMTAELRSLSLVDHLTGLYNRRGFLFLAKQQLKIADRMKRGLFLLFADVDDLKQINDSFGHREGDQALIETANVLKETFREADIIARIGGDEFAIITIEVRKDSAEVLTTRLRKNLDVRNAAGKRRYKLSISVGSAHYDAESPCAIDDLLIQADRLMYEQKRAK